MMHRVPGGHEAVQGSSSSAGSPCPSSRADPVLPNHGQTWFSTVGAGSSSHKTPSTMAGQRIEFNAASSSMG